VADEIRASIKENDSKLKTKGGKDGSSPSTGLDYELEEAPGSAAPKKGYGACSEGACFRASRSRRGIAENVSAFAPLG
jgi:hypothetical protein